MPSRRTKRNVRKMFEQLRRNRRMSWDEEREKEIDEVMKWVANGGLNKMFKDRDNEE